jgi:hypothetical protein
MLCRDAIGIYRNNYMEHMNRLCGHNLGHFNFENGSMSVVITGLMVSDSVILIMTYIQFLALFFTSYSYAVNRHIYLCSYASKT